MSEHPVNPAAGLFGKAKPAAPSAVAQAPKKDLKTLVGEWAATLTPSNAPPAAQKGQLAWVRETKVKELLETLAKAGIR